MTSNQVSGFKFITFCLPIWPFILTIFVDNDDGNWSEIPYEDTEKNLKWSLEIIAHMKNLISVVTTCEKIGHNHSIDVYDKEIRNFLDINFKN